MIVVWVGTGWILVIKYAGQILQGTIPLIVQNKETFNTSTADFQSRSNIPLRYEKLFKAAIYNLDFHIFIQMLSTIIITEMFQKYSSWRRDHDSFYRQAEIKYTKYVRHARQWCCNTGVNNNWKKENIYLKNVDVTFLASIPNSFRLITHDYSWCLNLKINPKWSNSERHEDQQSINSQFSFVSWWKKDVRAYYWSIFTYKQTYYKDF